MSPAQADYFGPYYADNYEHTFYITPSVPAAQATAIRWAMQNSVDAPTDMVDNELSAQTATTDVRFMHGSYSNAPYSGYYAWEVCVTAIDSQKCEKAQIVTNALNPHSNYKSLYCHEIGHSLGFEHEPGNNSSYTSANQSCMRASPDVLYYSTHDKGHINARY